MKKIITISMSKNYNKAELTYEFDSNNELDKIIDHEYIVNECKETLEKTLLAVENVKVPTPKTLADTIIEKATHNHTPAYNNPTKNFNSPKIDGISEKQMAILIKNNLYIPNMTKELARQKLDEHFKKIKL
ncbi:MAG: hypothetical protein ACRCXT_12425 [Paraclostridium sp.]